MLQELVGYLAHHVISAPAFSSLQKTGIGFCTKVSRINNRRCAEPVENNRRPAASRGAGGCRHHVLVLAVSASKTQVGSCQHNAKPPGPCHHKALLKWKRGCRRMRTRQQICHPVALWWALGIPGLLAFTSSIWYV